MIKIYGRTTSFNVQKVMWLLEELSLEYRHIELGGRFGGLDTDEFARLNPMRKIPVLVDGQKSVWESHTILRFLVAECGDTNWYPASSYLRSQYERWMDWAHTLFQPAFMATFWGYYRKPEKKRDMAMVRYNLEKCQKCLAIIDQQLSGLKYLAGEKISLADITAGAILYRLTEQGLEISLPNHVERWYRDLKSRQGYRKWIMSDFTELKGREDF